MTTILWNKVFEGLSGDKQDVLLDYLDTKEAIEKGLAKVIKVEQYDDEYYVVYFENVKGDKFNLFFNEEELVLDSSDF